MPCLTLLLALMLPVYADDEGETSEDATPPEQSEDSEAAGDSEPSEPEAQDDESLEAVTPPVPPDTAIPIPLDVLRGAGGGADVLGGAESLDGGDQPIDLSGAEDVPDLTNEQLEWLKPARHKLPQNPRGQTDYTAYTLEWGQVKLGLANVNVGIAPRVQLGTTPLLDAAGSYNLHLKANPLRFGPVDLAFQGAYYHITSGSFEANWGKIGGMTSVQILDPWSFHLGFSYDRLGGGGIPSLSNPLLASLLGTSQDDLKAIEKAAQDAGTALELEHILVSMRAATDLRFNRRDAIVIQFSGALRSQASRDIAQLPDGLRTELADSTLLSWFFVDTEPKTVGESLAATYVATASYQATWKQLEMRLGGGVAGGSALAWVLQSMELSYHFGGKTRSEERRMLRGWRWTKNRTDQPGNTKKSP